MSDDRPSRVRCGDCGFGYPTEAAACPACGWSPGSPAREIPDPDPPALERDLAQLDRRLAELVRAAPTVGERVRAARRADPGVPAAGEPDTAERLRSENEALRDKLEAARRTLETAARIAAQVASLHDEVDRLGTHCLRAREEATEARAVRAEVQRELTRIVEGLGDGRADPSIRASLKDRLERISRRLAEVPPPPPTPE